MSLIERLEKLDKAATPGPWDCDSCGDIYHSGKPQIRMREESGDNNFATTAYWKDGNPNAQLIAEMRNALPKLLALAKSAKALADYNDNFLKNVPQIGITFGDEDLESPLVKSIKIALASLEDSDEPD